MEIPGLTPTRRVETAGDRYLVYVKPPSFMELPEVCISLSADQYERYQRWRRKECLIQEALPDLSISQREMLMTGLGDEDFHRITDDED